MTTWWYIDNSTLEGQIKEAVIQSIFWSIVLTSMRSYLGSIVNNHKFFQHVASHEGGVDELLGWVTCVPQHTTSVVLLWLGMNLNRDDIFRSAVLAEFGYELYDLLRFYFGYFFSSKKQTKKEKQSALLALKAMTMHHLPGIVIIIPAINAFGTDPYFQNVVWSLLSYTPLWVLLIAAYKCCNINDLNGRTQFTVYYLICLAILIYGRFIWCPIEMYRFICHTFSKQTIWMKSGLIFYAILIYGFNFLVVMVSVGRLHKYMFGTKNKEVDQVKAVKMLRQTSSEDIFTEFVDKGFDFDFLRGNRKMPEKPKFKRHYTEPIHN